MISQGCLKENYNYDESTGLFTRLKASTNRVKVGETVGSPSVAGYLRASISGKFYLLHRLAFLYMEGYNPAYVDHINCVKSDNRWSNLREATRNQNEHNKSKYKNNTSGYKGVSYHTQRGRWRATIWLNGVQHHLGLFKTREEAYTAYCVKCEELHGTFANTT